ncbi:Zn-ribbon domain-containing OB-fold protein [Thermoflavimicrobium dichotomicum]|uniref:ChsH2 C-terminal OB-fold domain-containing protein n=1 Tax=Thermoflavimicrobium dichotomicum TaxID=46223 RepID=A0A1I3T856_9BACL|nr:OB-fold domain-containing protein [Thermoflavimicrobium dichotomicum]SFJ66773.1 hypothetical protein SAMN05421852_11637 [Thermoflavimicrobium dichotomicum]
MALRMTVYQCDECGLRQLIPQGYCSKCRSANSYRPIDLEITGTVFSFTRVHVCEERFNSEAPYLLAIIECEDGLRLMGRVQQPVEHLSIGSCVKLAEFREGTPIFRAMSCL